MKSIVLFATVLRIIIITALLGFAVYVSAQSVAVNSTGNSADASAMLDIASTSKGFLPPRMTTLQRTGIPSPANGLMVYDTNTKSYWYFSTTWKEIPDASGSGGNFALPYSGIADNTASVFSINNTHIGLGASAIYGKAGVNSSGIIPLGNSGVWGDNTNGIGVSGTSNSIGVFGATGLTDAGGVGVFAMTSSTSTDNGSLTALNQSSGNAVYAESSGGGTAIYGRTSKSNGAAIYGINFAIQGRAIQGAATGTDGVALYGEGGISGSSSYAGFFRNSNPANTRDVVRIYNQGAGRGLLVDQVNSANGDDVVEIRNYGTGNFLSLVTGTNEVKTFVDKSGNISTDGNVFTDGNIVVKGNKGIVRNSNGNQLRVEELTINVPAHTYNHFDSDFGPGGQIINVTFNTPFFSPPVVYKANCSAGALLSGLTVEFYDVTTTGCKMFISNYGPYDLIRSAGVYKAVAMGTE